MSPSRTAEYQAVRYRYRKVQRLIKLVSDRVNNNENNLSIRFIQVVKKILCAGCESYGLL